MLTVGRYQVLRLLRDKVLLVWTLAFPVIMSLIFMAAFSKLDGSYEADPIEMGIVQDSAYEAAEGFDAFIGAISSERGETHLINTHRFAAAHEAEAAAKNGDTAGFIAVEDGVPVLHVLPSETTANTIPVLRAALDSYAQSAAQYATLMAQGADPEQIAAAQVQHVSTQRAQITASPSRSTVRYYFSLLAFASGMGMNISMLAVQEIVAGSSPLGARRTLAGIPRWKVLTGTLGASWLCILACLLAAFWFIRLVVGIDFGTHTGLCHLAIAVSSLLSCAAGAALGTVRGLRAGIVSGITCLLSLFTGLYGTAAQQLADTVQQSLPLLAQLNPLWQAAHCFFSLLYYDSLAPFARSCAVMAAMTCLFLAIALIRMRRMSHEHL
ncbi:ABC transporter permease [Propionibacterium australiense]|uniref:ABC transporter permease n=1 Tax=Propionibacterium australiense TaxID=119981 RepID=A0A8B3FMM0_9ACTN|nr:ABC transporter permease [Propionibacterium australiense]RLP10736.1 ABC transporter permease [Propionibacterium australiense]